MSRRRSAFALVTAAAVAVLAVVGVAAATRPDHPGSGR